MDGFGTLGVAIVIGLALRQRALKLRQAAAADASTDVNRDLTPGPCVLRGVVEYAQDAKWAVRVDVDQEGEEHESSGVWTYKWTEKNRRVHLAPFYARLASGRRIRVEPSGEVLLVDSMDGIVRVDLKKRTRFAELVPGETIYASGQLVRAPDRENSVESGGYRNSPDSFVLRPLPPNPMLFSTESLGARFRERGLFHERAAKWIAAVALFIHAALFGFHARRYLGNTEDATLVNIDHYTTQDEGRDVYHYRVELQTDDGFKFIDHIPYAVFKELKAGMRIPIRRAYGSVANRSTVGPNVTVNSIAWIFPVYLLVAWIAYRHWEKSTRPWYERKVIDTGSGRLEESLAKERGSSARS